VNGTKSYRDYIAYGGSETCPSGCSGGFSGYACDSTATTLLITAGTTYWGGVNMDCQFGGWIQGVPSVLGPSSLREERRDCLGTLTDVFLTSPITMPGLSPKCYIATGTYPGVNCTAMDALQATVSAPDGACSPTGTVTESDGVRTARTPCDCIPRGYGNPVASGDQCVSTEITGDPSSNPSGPASLPSDGAPPGLPGPVTVGQATRLGSAVSVPVSLAPVVATPRINCGTTPSQILPGFTGLCVYTTPGTFNISASYSQNGTDGTTTPVPVTIPALPPTNPQLRISLVGQATPTHDGSGPIPIDRTGQPSIYPVPVQLALTVDPPSPTQLGVPDPLDPVTSTVYVKAVATTADLTAPIAVGDPAAPLSSTTDPTTFTASLSLSRFVVNQNNPSSWRQRFILQAWTVSGQPVSTELYLDGQRGDGSQIQFTWKRIDPIYPYAPTTYRYTISGLSSAVLGEPMTQHWTSSDGTTKTIQGDGYFDATFTSPGLKSAELNAGGPLSGTKTWQDPNPPTIPPMPPGNPIAFYITPPRYNRPPATYRFAPNYPPLAPGERITGDPTWSVDGQPVFTGAIFYSTFTTAGPHTVTISQPTTLPRLLGGSTTITVNPNQVPVGSIDCSGSYLDKTTTPKTYVLSCKAVNTSDPDGQIVSLVWTLPDVPYQKAGGSYVHYGFPSPQVVPVQMVLTDNSGGTATISTSVDLSTVR
jgi:hypothetical protein